MRRTSLIMLLAGACLLAINPVWAGPPAICRAIDIGSAESLPWGTGSDFHLTDPAYDIPRLMTDTLGLLTPSAPVRVRMETMRRAAIYSAKDPRLSFELAARLMARALDAELTGNPNPMAWFDAGYFVETLKQAALVYRWDMLSPSKRDGWTFRRRITGIDGIPWVRKAMRVNGEKKDFHFALSLIDFETDRTASVN